MQTHLLDGSIVGLAAARLARTPVAIMTAHDAHELPFHGWRFMGPERVCAGPLCDHVIAPSQQVKQTLVNLAGVPDHKVDVVHHGFDLERLRPATVDGGRIRQELGLEGKLVFGSIGRLYWLKNYPALVEAFATVLNTEPDARLVIVGPGDATPVLELARGLGIADRVVVSEPRTDVPELLAAFDVFVHPAIAESFGMVIVEAMAVARPVLSTPVGIAPEVIQTGRTGVLSSGHSPEELARGLREILALRSRWRALGEAARVRVGGFTARAMAEQYEALYSKWLRGRSKR